MPRHSAGCDSQNSVANSVASVNRLTLNWAGSYALCRENVHKRQKVGSVEDARQPAQRTDDAEPPNDINSSYSFYLVKFTGILFEIDSFLATRIADHSP